MQRFLLLYILIAVGVLLIIGSFLGIFSFFSTGIKTISAPFLTTTFSTSKLFFGGNQTALVSKLTKENKDLTTKLMAMEAVKNDNTAYKDQFATAQIPTNHLLAAHIIGAPTFIPGVTTIQKMVLDKGKKDGVKIGQAVVYQNNLVGQITQVTQTLCEVTVAFAVGSSFTAQTSNAFALGVIKGQGTGHMLFDNVNTTDKLAKNDLVVTKGTITINGQGIPPNLLVGKVVAVNKKSSALFQTADVLSQVNLERASMLFVIIKYE